MSVCKGTKDIKKIEQKFLKKHNLDESTGRAYRDENCKIHKEVWQYGKGWISEAAFIRYMNIGGIMQKPYKHA